MGALWDMPTRPSKRKDALQAAARIVQQTTEQPLPKLAEIPQATDEEKQLRSEAASILGKLGGSKGGKARAAALSGSERTEIAKKAAQARWHKKK
jgi:hypothetical protein